MSVEYLENEILHIAERFKDARMQKDDCIREADMQYIGALFRMLEFSIELSRDLRQMGKSNKEEVC